MARGAEHAPQLPLGCFPEAKISWSQTELLCPAGFTESTEERRPGERRPAEEAQVSSAPASVSSASRVPSLILPNVHIIHGRPSAVLPSGCRSSRLTRPCPSKYPLRQWWTDWRLPPFTCGRHLYEENSHDASAKLHRWRAASLLQPRKRL